MDINIANVIVIALKKLNSNTTLLAVLNKTINQANISASKNHDMYETEALTNTGDGFDV